VYYFNTDNWRSDERFSDVLASFNIRFVPTLVEMKDGEISVVFSGNQDYWPSAFYR